MMVMRVVIFKCCINTYICIYVHLMAAHVQEMFPVFALGALCVRQQIYNGLVMGLATLARASVRFVCIRLDGASRVLLCVRGSIRIFFTCAYMTGG